MIKQFLGAVLLALALFTAAPAKADSLASAENVFTAIQVADVYTTQRLLHGPNWQCGPNICHATEANPLARPFVHSPWTNAAIAAAMNIGLRLVDSHGSRNPSALWMVNIGYAGIVGHNAYLLGIQRKFSVK